MEPNKDGQQVQKTAEELQKEHEAAMLKVQAELDESRKKAEVSSQNFERLKKAEEELKEARAKLAEKGESVGLDPVKLKQEIEDKVSLRLAGRSPEQIEEIERYARGANISLAEAAKSPFIVKAVEALEAEKKSTDNTPSPSAKIRVFNGKPIDEIFKTGTPAEKEAAFKARMSGGGKNNE